MVQLFHYFVCLSIVYNILPAILLPKLAAGKPVLTTFNLAMEKDTKFEINIKNNYVFFVPRP
jgi:hypothetical protein